MDRSKFSFDGCRFTLTDVVLFIVLIFLANLKVTNVIATKQRLQSKITVKITISNEGDTDAGGFYIGHYIQNEKRITTKTTVDEVLQIPAIYGDRIVWLDNQDGDIYMYDLSTGKETQITNNPSSHGNPAIYGDRIVWEDYRNGNYDIYMKDLNTGLETQITNNPADQLFPSIYGDRIVWEDLRNGNRDIYMKDLSTGVETQITNNPLYQSNPLINGDRIIWLDGRNGIYGNNQDIYMIDLSNGLETRIGNFTDIPAIYGDRIVWTDNRDDLWRVSVDSGESYFFPVSDIYIKDLSTGQETQITTNPNSYPSSPAIYGDRIVWEDWRNGNSDIYMKDLSTGLETQITCNQSYQSYPSIYGDRIVWFDSRNNIATLDPVDIYMSDGITVLPEYVYVPGLAAGASKFVQTDVTLPDNIEGGVNYYIGAIVDAAGMVVQSDESDKTKLDPNSLTFKNMILPLHKRPLNVPDVDLVISNLYNPPLAESGSFILVPNSVKNNGLKESGSFIVKFYISSNTNNTISSGDEYLGERTIWALYGKSTNRDYTELMIPPTINPGIYYLKAFVDATNSVVESNKNNNIKTSNLPITITANTTPPQVIISDPVNNALNVPIIKMIKITFNEPIKDGLNYNDIEIRNGNTKIGASYWYIGNVLNIRGYYSNGVKYTLTLPANSIEDLAGNPLPQTYTTTFTTSP